jgi:hypothetical protein
MSQIIPTYNVTMTDFNNNFRGWINVGAGGQFTKDSKPGTTVTCILNVASPGPWIYATITYIAGKMWLAQLVNATDATTGPSAGQTLDGGNKARVAIQTGEFFGLM